MFKYNYSGLLRSYASSPFGNTRLLVKSNVKIIDVYLDPKPHHRLGIHDCVYISVSCGEHFEVGGRLFPRLKSNVKIIEVYLDPSLITIWESKVSE